MCNLSDGVEQKGIEKGVQQGRSEERTNMILNALKNVTVDEVKKFWA